MSSERQTLAVFDRLRSGAEPLSTSELAAELNCHRDVAVEALDELVERGEVESKTIGDERVWWRGADSTPTDDATNSDSDASASLASSQFRSLVAEVEEYAIFLLDADGTVVTWNSGAKQIKGYDAADIVGEHVSTFYTEEDRTAGVPERNLARARETGRTQDEGWRVREDGTTFWASVSITARRTDDGSLEGFTKVTRDMTERREYEQQLRKERDLTEEILNTAPVALSVRTADGTVLKANQRAQEVLGLSEAEIIEDPDDIDEWSAYDADDEPLDDHETPTARALATHEPVYDEEVAIEKPGEERRWFSVNAAPVFDDDGTLERVVSASEEITDLKEHERQLERRKRELETELSEVLGRISDAFYALDEEWRFTHVNERAEEIFGRSEDEMLGEAFWEVYPESTDAVIWEQFHEAMESQEPRSFEFFAESLDAWLQFSVYPSETGLSVYFRDDSERVEREQKLEQFASIVSHDLRNPLAIAEMYLGMARDGGDPEHFDEIDRALDRMQTIIDNLLTMAQAGESITDTEPTVPSDVAEDAWQHVETHDATLDADETMPTVLADRDRLQTAFENLFRNAIEHAGTEVAVRVGTLEAEPSGDSTDASVGGFYVEDDGPGIDTDRPNEVFEYGYSPNGGTGFGLAIVNEVVEAHGWEISVTESDTGGARFEVRYEKDDGWDSGWN
ncbi:PAS domain-containing protein [Halorussus halophilus]|uniref:PAS domain-containing protein n=1 Tax=Halorussus halophilus TaxID=2650975 RepID=UPI001300EEAF|nr:PAS domain S-box protein [Halorussus halophilus]